MSQYASYTGYTGSGGGGGSGNITDINGQVGPSITISGGPGITINTTTNNIEIENTGSLPVGTPNSFAGFDSSGDLFSIPNWEINTQGGANQSITLTPDDSAGAFLFNNFQNTISPIENLAGSTYLNTQFYLYLNGPFSHSNTVVVSNGADAAGEGDYGNIQIQKNSLILGDGTNVSTSQTHQLSQSDLTVRNAHTVEQTLAANNVTVNIEAGAEVTGTLIFNHSMNVDGISDGGDLNMYAISTNIREDQPMGIGMNMMSMGGTIEGEIQYINGYSANFQIQTDGVVRNAAQMFQDNFRLSSGGQIQGHTSFASFANFDSGSSLTGNIISYSASPNINTAVPNGYFGVAINPQITGAIQGINHINVGSNIQSGAVITNGTNGLNEGTVIRSGATIADYNGVGVFPTLEAGATADRIRLFTSYLQTDGTITGGVNLMEVNINGSSVVPEVTGVRVNLNQIQSTQQKTGLSSQDGRIEVQAKYNSEDYGGSPGFIGMNGIGGVFEVEDGFPVSNTLTIANSIGVSTIFGDDYGADPFVGTLGLINIGMNCQGSVALGKTVTSYNHMLIAYSVPDVTPQYPGFVDGGTMTNAYMMRVFGFLPSGGNISITNQYQLYMDDGGGSFATNKWGLFIADNSYENYFKSSIAIDTGSTKVSNSNVALEIGGTTKALRHAVLTTSERDALTPLSGMEIFNSDSLTLEFFDGTSWTSGGGGSFALTDLSNLTTTSIPTNLLFSANQTFDVGSGSARANNVYTNIANMRQLRFQAAAGGVVNIVPATLSTSHNLIWPANNATGVLNNNGSGTLSWAAAPTPTVVAMFTPYIYGRIAGSSADVSNNAATDDVINDAIINASAGDPILVLRAVYSGTTTFDKNLKMTGQGYGAFLTGDVIFDTGSDYSVLEGLRITGNITINAGVKGVQIINCWIDAAGVVTDNGDGSYIQLIRES